MKASGSAESSSISAEPSSPASSRFGRAPGFFFSAKTGNGRRSCVACFDWYSPPLHPVRACTFCATSISRSTLPFISCDWSPASVCQDRIIEPCGSFPSGKYSRKTARIFAHRCGLCIGTSISRSAQPFILCDCQAQQATEIPNENCSSDATSQRASDCSA